MKKKRNTPEKTALCDGRKDARNQSEIFEVVYWYVSCDDKRVAKRSNIVDDFRRKLIEQRHCSLNAQRAMDWVVEDKSEMLNGQFNLKLSAQEETR